MSHSAVMKLNKATSKVELQYVESAVMPPTRISAGTPVLLLRFSSRFWVSMLGLDKFPTYEVQKAVSMLKLASAGLRYLDASGGSVEGPDKRMLERFSAKTQAEKARRRGRGCIAML